ncbi:MAG: hypothetical protein AABX10_02970 [Nanoarchaeota archaeon]
MKAKKYSKEISHDHIAYVTIFLILAILSATFMGVLKSVYSTEENCDYLACQYKEEILPYLELSFAALFLPFFLLYVFKLNFPPIINLISFFITPVYWLGMAWLINVIFRRKKEKKIIKPEDFNSYLLVKIGGVMVVIFFFMLTLISFLYYPKISIDINYKDFLVVASIIVALVTFYHRIKNEDMKDISTRNIVRLSILSLMFLILGAFTSFIQLVRLKIVNENLVDTALIQSIPYGFMGAGLVGLAIIMFGVLDNLLPRIKKKVK